MRKYGQDSPLPFCSGAECVRVCACARVRACVCVCVRNTTSPHPYKHAPKNSVRFFPPLVLSFTLTLWPLCLFSVAF